MAQVSATLPVKPPLGVIVMVDVALAPGDATLTGVALSANVGVMVGPDTVITMLLVSDMLPEVPVTAAV
jgi:hypothetical protein